jgi:4-hydroxy-2-oxoheptanedioate aldolase
MIETRAALEAVEEIVAVPGVGALFLGAYDLSLALGLPPAENDGDPVFDAAVARVIAAANGAGIPVAMMASVEKAPLRLEQGFRMLSVCTDIYSLAAAVTNDVGKVRDAAGAR